MEILKFVPKNLLSRTVGHLVQNESPRWLAAQARNWFQKRYQINMDEAEFPLDNYPTIGKLFTRRLKPGVRPLGSGAVHPCDGRLTVAQAIDSETLVQAKGKTYSLQDLVVDPNARDEFIGGAALTYYLCPTDYHRVHAPVDGEVSKITHVPGALWPVNDWSVHNIAALFTINERVVFRLQTPMGPVVLVMVGATNVGKITVSFDPQIASNRAGQSHVPFMKTYRPAVSLKKGDEVGIFNMGSTVVVLYPPRMLTVLPKLGSVKFGESV